MNRSRIDIHADRDLGPLPRFWRATGFANAECLFDPAYRRQLEMAAALPRRAIEHVRIHRLLDLVAAEDGQTPDGSCRYDFTRLDEGLDFLVNLGLRPFFELMGNPSQRFSDFNDSDQLERWRGLIAQLAAHLIDRYGAREVEGWYFETWNEPDCEAWWKQFHDDPPSLCGYYDACEHGLHSVNPRLQLGGPGGQGNLNDTTRAFLAHCDHGVNHFTQQRGTRLDFISVHEKAAPMTPEDVDPDVGAVLRREARFLDYIRQRCPRLHGVPFMNDEADPQIGWNAHHSWHAAAYYPAFAARMIGEHLSRFVDDDTAPEYAMLLNDNGFVGRWGQRTLTAWIGEEAGVGDGRFELLPKPIFHLMGMLSRLRGQRCCATVERGGPRGVGVIAVRDERSVTLLAYHHRDSIRAAGRADLTLVIEGLDFGLGWLRYEQLADDGAAPFELWQRMGAASLPTPEQMRLLRAAAAAPTHDAVRPIAAREGRFELDLTLPLPGVSVVQLVADDPVKLDAPHDLRAEACRDVHGRPACWLTWRSDGSPWARHHRIDTLDEARGSCRQVAVLPSYLNAVLLPDADRLGPDIRVTPVDLRGHDGPAITVANPRAHACVPSISPPHHTESAKI